MASKELIACMSRAKGDAKKIAACKSSFAKKVPPKKESEYTLKQRMGRAIDRELMGGHEDISMYDKDPSLYPPKWRPRGKKPLRRKNR